MSKAHGNFFSLPNDIFELSLSPGTFKVYCYLRCCANRKTNQCYPSYETIGDAVGLCKNTIARCICELVDMRLIHMENTSVITRNGLKHNGSLLYTVLGMRPVLEKAHQRKIQNLKLETARWNRSKTENPGAGCGSSHDGHRLSMHLRSGKGNYPSGWPGVSPKAVPRLRGTK